MFRHMYRLVSLFQSPYGGTVLIRGQKSAQQNSGREPWPMEGPLVHENNIDIRTPSCW